MVCHGSKQAAQFVVVQVAEVASNPWQGGKERLQHTAHTHLRSNYKSRYNSYTGFPLILSGFQMLGLDTVEL